MTMEPIVQPTPLAEVDVAVIGAGPCRADDGESAWSFRIGSRCSEVREGLRGIPRAIAYDAETLRSFSIAGLFDEIAPELVQSPHVRHVNARGRTLMEMDFPPRGSHGHSPLGIFYQPQFEQSPVHGLSRFADVRALFEHMVTGYSRAS